MDTLHVTVNRTKADIGATLSGLIAAEKTVGPTADRGRGRVRLCNADDNAKLFLAFQSMAPGSDVAGIPVAVGDWFPEEVDIVPGGGVWAWSNRDATKVVALVTKWSA